MARTGDGEEAALVEVQLQLAHPLNLGLTIACLVARAGRELQKGGKKTRPGLRPQAHRKQHCNDETNTIRSSTQRLNALL